MLLLWVCTILLDISSLSSAQTQSFPDGFMFGVATAAYQVEGAWDEDKKGENIWDHFVHQSPSVIKDNQTGDVACDSYHKYKDDVALMVDMGLSHYRFSISWTRILPTGFSDIIQYKGVAYYQNLISELEKYNITPVVTLYHWDLPQSIEEHGGWLNSTIVDYFVDYAKVVFGFFGDRVDYWITINEPKQVCTGGYGKGSKAPGLKEDGTADYICAYNLLKAHAAVYHLYKDELKLNGNISLALDGLWTQPASTKLEDQNAAKRKMEFELGLYANPVFNGDWPKIVIDRVQERSNKENLTSSRLPTFSKDEIDYIKGTADFLGFNYYTANIVGDADEDEDYTTPGLAKDIRVNATVDSSWQQSATETAIVPWAFTSILRYIKGKYDNPLILITENGVGDDGSNLDDAIRIEFMSDHLRAMLEAMEKDKVNVFGYTLWSLMDNFEWLEGYKAHFGLYSVDFTKDDRPRIAKRSVSFYAEVVTTLTIPDSQVSSSTEQSTSTDAQTITDNTGSTDISSIHSSSNPDGTTQPTGIPDFSTMSSEVTTAGGHRNFSGVLIWIWAVLKLVLNIF